MSALSIRIVTVDHYLHAPLTEFDASFSEFRGSEIKYVPVLRVFGITPDGAKICTHVHGVFPYLYIPCDVADPEPKLLYQIANSVDKALNISLKQTSSTNQHVYKITLVKGIPFYGYHRREHQFFKIYFYNPAYIKRVSDLLCSGAVMGVSYQPHEAHINYVMQFFIDFNLFGMSLINISQFKFRENIENSTSSATRFVPKMTSCKLEMDCFAQHILNRRDILNGNLGINPGIEALWLDERRRRKDLNMSDDVSPTQSQFRENSDSTESHKYFRNKFIMQLALNSEFNTIESETTLQSTLVEPNDSTISSNNLVYPIETLNEKRLLNATAVAIHHLDSDNKNITNNSQTPIPNVNEDIVMQCSQISNTSDVKLSDDDIQFMEMLKEMEGIENDSILGTQLEENENFDEDAKKYSQIVDSEDSDNLFKKSQDKDSDCMLKWNDSFWENIENISQLDGSWDTDIDTKKQSKKSIRIGLSRPPRKCKKTPQIEPDTKKQKISQDYNIEEKFGIFENTPPSVRLKNTPTKSPRKISQKSPNPSPNKYFKKFEPLNIIVSSSNNTHKIKHEILDTPAKKAFKNMIKKEFTSHDSDERPTNISENRISNSVNSVEVVHLKEYNEYLEGVPKNNSSISEKNVNIETDPSSIDLNEVNKNNTPTSLQYDGKNDIFPRPSTSKDMDIQKNECFDNVNFKYDDTLVDDREIESFYVSNYFHDSSIMTLNEDLSSSKLKNKKESTTTNLGLNLSVSDDFEKFEVITSSVPKKKLIITSKSSPPSYSDIYDTMNEFNIPHYRNPIPFYSKHDDESGQIELGQVVLKLKSKKMANLKEFPSSFADLFGILSWREKRFLQSNLSQVNIKRNELDILLSSNRSCILSPVLSPPSVNKVKKWIKTNIKNECKEDNDNLNQEKNVVYLPNSPEKGMNDNSQMEITLTPFILTTQNSDKTITPNKRVNFDDNLIENSENAIKSNYDDQDLFICGQNIIESKVFSGINSSLHNGKSMENSSEMSSLSVHFKTNVTNNYKFSGDNYQDAPVHHEHDYLTIMALEVLTSARGDLNPDPTIDPICAVFYSILNDCPEYHHLPQTETRIILIEEDFVDSKIIYPEAINKNIELINAKSELEMFQILLNAISNWDPDILCGYEIEMASWGYLFQRAFILDMNFASKVSRVSLESKYGKFNKDSGEINREIKLIGRITLNVWRLLRHELALTSYSFENVFYHVLHERIPYYSHKTLAFWWNHPSKKFHSLAMEYYLTRVKGIIRILQQLDLIGRTSELARLFGIQWYEVLSRGSQFRVESMMIRLTRPFNYVLVSPSVQQRATMNAPESLPLILEPESRFYSDPVIVLDFQSLYPSMMIAYNYCFSTCIGKVENLGRNLPFKFGATQLRVSASLLKKLNEKDLINWSPCGVGFVKSVVRKGILPTMLQDILNTRFMVKKAMKKHKKNKTLQKILHNRQLGLKLIANVTYGYTAANFSGRMPSVEVGDSVVSKGRETLERAIRMIESEHKWRAKVVYGDTDSVFVLVSGRSRDEAFQIGAEIAEAVTNDNPSPVKLKLEKVYQPCILQTKKRYVGYMYESKSQVTPTYDAKGIETVRRDGCPAAVKILEKSLKILFDTYDVSKVKSYVYQKFQNMIEGKCNLQDFIFAKEFRGMNAYRPNAAVPALEIIRKRKQVDHRYEPREGERVPYVIISAAPGEILLHSAHSPRDLLMNPSLKINYNYYITKVVIPPLNRCLSLIGVDVNQWFAEMPRRQLQLYPIIQNENNVQIENKKFTISQYFAKVNCVVCDQQTMGGLCENCIEKPQSTMLTLQEKINTWQRKFLSTQKICQSCCGRTFQLKCSSLDCPITFSLNSLSHDIEQIPFIKQIEKRLLDMF